MSESINNIKLPSNYIIAIYSLSVIFITCVFISRIRENKSFVGVWVADDDFCQLAELQSFIILIDSSSLFSQKHNCYFLASNDSGIIINDSAVLTTNFNLNIKPYISTCKEYVGSFEWSSEDVAFPKTCNMHYYPLSDKLVFYDKDEVLVSLWRDPKLSDKHKKINECQHLNTTSVDDSSEI